MIAGGRKWNEDRNVLHWCGGLSRLRSLLFDHHLFCAMSDRARLRQSQTYPMRGGLMEATLYFDALTTEVIADAKHLCRELLLLAHKTRDRIAWPWSRIATVPWTCRMANIFLDRAMAVSRSCAATATGYSPLRPGAGLRRHGHGPCRADP